MKKLLLSILLLAGMCAASAAPSPYINAAVSNTPIFIKAAPTGGTVYLWAMNLTNTNTSAVFVQVFDKLSSDTITPGSTVPTWAFGIPANGGVLDSNWPKPLSFSKGIWIIVTTTQQGGSAPSTAVPTMLAYE